MRWIALSLVCAACSAAAPAPSTSDPVEPTTVKPVAEADAEPPPPPDAAVPDATPPPPPKTGEIVQVTVVSADIRGSMPNNESWDGNQAVGSVPRPLERYLYLHPELEDTRKSLGIPVDIEDLPARASKSPAADPMVLIEVGDAAFRSPVELRAFHPLWDFSFQFLHGSLGERQGVPRGAMVRIHVVDYDGPDHFDAVGSVVLSMDELLSKPVHELGPFGSVDKLTLQVRVLDEPEDVEGGRSVRLAVPGSPSWIDTGIDVVAGQRVWIQAADEMCTTRKSDSTCSGPEGQRSTSESNLRGFEAIGHGTLVGAVGDTRFVVRRGLRFVAPASGRLRLGVNDRDTGNNRGAYAVHVMVYAVP